MLVVRPQPGQAITSGVKDMQAVLNLVWNQLLPALGSKRLHSDPAAESKLKSRLASLVLRMPEGAASSPGAAKFIGRTYAFAANDQNVESVSVTSDGAGGLILTSRIKGVESRISCGHRSWKKGRAPFGLYPDAPVAGSFSWVTDDTLALRICLSETPFVSTLKLHFQGDQVTRELETNVGPGSTRPSALTGRAE